MAKKDKEVSEGVTEEVTSEEKAPVVKKKTENITKDSVVTVLVETNPKREGSKAFDRFQFYFGLSAGATVTEAIAAGLTLGDIQYDFIHGNIDVEGATVIEYTPQPRGSKSAESDEEAPVLADAEEAGEEGFE